MSKKSGAGKSVAGTKIVFLGGAGEIGRNMTVFEQGGRLLVLDAGLMFPTEEMLGVDLVLPDFGYLADRASKIDGLLLTHGHEDHVGAVPFLLKELKLDIYGSPLTLGLLKPKLEEHQVLDRARLHEIVAPADFKVGTFDVSVFPVVHSIPSGFGTVIHAAGGRIVHTGDFKIDSDPGPGIAPTNIEKLRELGDAGVDLLMSDSTNAERPGTTPSEKTVSKALDEVLAQAEGRVVIACFASNVQRVQEIIATAQKYERLVCLLGRTMLKNVAVARELGFIDAPDGLFIPREELEKVPDKRVVVVSTGSQGEPLSALSLMAAGAHKWVELVPSDTVVLSATPIPGNESAVRRVIDGLFRIGCKLIHPPAAAVHVSGHGSSEDLKTMLGLIRPRWFVPVHGEYRQMVTHARLAAEVGVPEEKTLVVEDGDVLMMESGSIKRLQKVRAGYTLVDGIGIGDVGPVVLRDRRVLADDGIIVCVVTIDSQTGELLAGPDVISRGFLHEEENTDFLERAKSEIRESLASLAQDEVTEWSELRRAVRRALGKFVWDSTRRRPMILPVVMEV